MFNNYVYNINILNHNTNSHITTENLRSSYFQWSKVVNQYPPNANISFICLHSVIVSHQYQKYVSFHHSLHITRQMPYSPRRDASSKTKATNVDHVWSKNQDLLHNSFDILLISAVLMAWRLGVSNKCPQSSIRCCYDPNSIRSPCGPRAPRTLGRPSYRTGEASPWQDTHTPFASAGCTSDATPWRHTVHAPFQTILPISP